MPRRMASLRAWISGGPDRASSGTRQPEKTSTTAQRGSCAAFFARAPADVLLWPPSEEAYERTMRGLVPFVFIGRRHPITGVVSGVILVNAELRDETLWFKIDISHPPGRALATVEVAGNVRRFAAFPEVEVLAICVHGVARGGGVLLEEASEAELLEIAPAYKVETCGAQFCFVCLIVFRSLQKYKKLSCGLVQEDAIAIQMIFDRHASFVGSPSARALFLEFFVSCLENKPQDLIFVLKKPLARPIVQFVK